MRVNEKQFRTLWNDLCTGLPLIGSRNVNSYFKRRACDYCNEKTRFCRRMPNGLLRCVYCTYGIDAEDERASFRVRSGIQELERRLDGASSDSDDDLRNSAEVREEGSD
jgi:hypothetical protein